MERYILLFFFNLVHCGSLRQTAQIVSMSQDCLRTGDKALVHFRFIKHPEYIKPGLRLVNKRHIFIMLRNFKIMG